MSREISWSVMQSKKIESLNKITILSFLFNQVIASSIQLPLPLYGLTRYSNNFNTAYQLILSRFFDYVTLYNNL